jgi:tetratricopeptide (TPR) repeat protein
VEEAVGASGPNPYETLGVANDSNDGEIKRAYYRLVREHPPERDPEGFKAIRGAYDLLSDEVSRTNYDSLSAHGDEIERLFSEARGHMEEEEWSKAAGLLKRLLLLNPALDIARLYLGMCYHAAEDWTQAETIVRGLIERDDSVAFYWIVLGRTLAARFAATSGQEAEQAAHDATDAVNRSIELDPYNANAYQVMADLASERGDHGETVSWLEKAVQADGQVDLQDFDILFTMCMVHVRHDELPALKGTVRRIQGLVADADDEARNYVSWRFATVMAELIEAEAWSDAAVFARASRELAPDNEDLAGYTKAVESISGALDEFAELKDDASVVDPLKGLAQLALMSELGRDVEDADSIFQGLLGALGGFPLQRVTTSIRRIRSKYRATYALRRDLYLDLERTANKLAQTASSQVNTASSSGASTTSSSGASAASSDGCFVATATFQDRDDPAVVALRAFRDHVLARTPGGRALIRLYRAVGPLLARIVYTFPCTRWPLQRVLRRLAGVLLTGQSSSRYTH